ncbi:MAG TPA: amidohydrolase family protein [Candidatus Bathyarchaeia archaeon]|nr:amidohydrolase family protein [Candidatus Bathyarchaeia archaeon]
MTNDNNLFMQTLLKQLNRAFNRRVSCQTFQAIVFIILIFPLVGQPFILQVDAAEPVLVDCIFCNSNIITVDETNPLAEAIAIKDGVIVAVGDTGDILENYQTVNNTCFDLDGLTIMPGIIDGHTHLMWSMLYGGFETMLGAQQIALAFGFTTLNEKGVDGWDRDIQPLLDAEQNNELLLRVNIFPIYNLAFLDENNEPMIVERWYPDHEPILEHDRMLRVPGIKIYSDGALGNRGLPAMSTPYTQEMLDAWGGTDPYGNLYFNQTELNSIVKTIHDKGFSCAFHSMGDRSTETVLNAIEFALDGETNDNYRHQIEHNSFIREDLITQAISLNTIHSVRGYFPTYWQKEYEDIYDSNWEEWYVNRYSLPGLGVHSYLETDFTWEVYDDDDVSNCRNIKPFLHMWGLVTRKAIDENGTIHTPDPWVAEHEITVEQALKMMTIEGAYAVKQEDYLGSLEVGKYADLIVLTADPLTINPDEIKDIQVMLTMVGGNIEYQWPSHTFPLPCGVTPSARVSSWTSLFAIPSIFLMTVIIRKKKRE